MSCTSAASPSLSRRTEQFFGAAAIILRPLAYGVGMELAHAVIAAQSETFCQPRQCRRRNAGAARLLAH